jgi:hypothetical protein
MGRCAIVTLEKIPAILSGNLFVCRLRTHGSHTPLVQRGLLLRGRTGFDTAVSAVIAHSVDRYIVDDCSVDVHIPDDGGVYVAHSCVVVETIAAPVAAFISTAVIAEAVVHAAVEADVRSPVSGMPRVAATTPAPITWCPQQAVAGCNDPGSGNPVIVIATPSPVAWCPDVIRARANGLIVDGQSRWSDVDRDSYADLSE